MCVREKERQKVQSERGTRRLSLVVVERLKIRGKESQRKEKKNKKV